MSHPKRVREFIPWSKAMVAGATVGNPEYKSTRGKKRSRSRRARARRRKSKVMNG